MGSRIWNPALYYLLIIMILAVSRKVNRKSKAAADAEGKWPRKDWVITGVPNLVQSKCSY